MGNYFDNVFDDINVGNKTFALIDLTASHVYFWFLSYRHHTFKINESFTLGISWEC